MMIPAFKHLLRFCFVAVLFLTVAAPAQAEYADIIINKRAEANGMRPVIYPHWFHRIRFRCKVCHTEKGFIMRAGSNEITMKDIVEGRFCGMCHNGQIAWTPDNCHRCHSGLPGLQSGVTGADQTRGPGHW